MTPPRITIEFSMDDERYTLMATSYGQTMPAGPRLFRAPPHPAIAFSHDTEASAAKDAKALQDYIDAVWVKRGPSRKAVRAMGAD